MIAKSEYDGRLHTQAEVDRMVLKARIDEWKQFGEFLSGADKREVSRNFLDLYRLHGERLMSEKTDQYKCPSHYDDEGVLRDCTCGKCSDKD